MARRKGSKTSRQNKAEAGLNPHLFSKIKQEYHDIDYVDKLSDEDKKFLSTFMQEWLGARLNHPNEKLHSSKKDRKRVFDMNNARQRDIYSIAKATGKLHYNVPEAAVDVEEEMIDLISELQEAELIEAEYNSGDDTE